MLCEIKPPYLGAAYYPECWEPELIDEDIQKMKEAGINCARIAEFAWSSMEPREGIFDFSWLHTAVDKLYAAGIAVILCTPTVTPPKWLTDKYEETCKCILTA
jgi:beta-galactosidase GanA